MISLRRRVVDQRGIYLGEGHKVGLPTEPANAAHGPGNYWKGFQKMDQGARIIRGFWLVGAAMNIANALSPDKLPKPGTLDWHVCRHAYAQLEASIILESQSPDPMRICPVLGSCC